jgi:hypothetical protein
VRTGVCLISGKESGGREEGLCDIPVTGRGGGDPRIPPPTSRLLVATWCPLGRSVAVAGERDPTGGAKFRSNGSTHDGGEAERWLTRRWRQWWWWWARRRLESMQTGSRVLRLGEQRVHGIRGRRLPRLDAGDLVEDLLHDERSSMELAIWS